MSLELFERIPLAALPTPLEPAPRLGEALGIPRLWLKRDDCTGLALGGNKARKLEYLMADGVRQGADVVLTCGGVQSNHARMTAAAASRLGMRCVLILCGEPPAAAQGNLLLDRVLGAETRFVPGITSAEALTVMEDVAADLRARGQRPYIIPVGGSTPLGCLGYVRAVQELSVQAEAAGLRVDAVVVAAGSLGTLAGVLVGQGRYLPETRVYGISVSPGADAAREAGARLAGETAALLKLRWKPGPEEIPVRDDWLGAGYGIPTAEGQTALELAARTEGVLLDPVYTAKALAGAAGLAREGALRPDETVVFWHTGGAPALFAFEPLFSADRTGAA